MKKIMKIAILLLCHKNIEQINRFLDLFCDKHYGIFVHIDKKSNIGEHIHLNPNVRLLPDDKRVDVKWAGYSQIEATNNLIELAHSIGKFDYYWLCSGQDFPIKSNTDILSFFYSKPKCNYINLFCSLHNGSEKSTHYDKRNDIRYLDFLMGREWWKKILRRSYVFLTGGYNYTFPFFKRKLDDMKFYFGSQWWCLNNDTIEWIINYHHNHPIYDSYFRRVSTPDESYYHTLVMNSPYKIERLDYLHYIEFSENEPSPRILVSADIDLLNNTSFLMARKFDSNIDNNVISYYEKNFYKEKGSI